MQKIRTTIITGLIIMITGICYATEVIDRIVAVVNDDLITLSDLNRYISSIPPGTAEIDRDRVLNDLVEQMILEQEAAKLGITVSDPEIDMSIENIRTKAGMSHELMEEMLKKENLTKEQFRKQWRLQIISGKLVNSIVKGRVAVTDDEIENLYKEYYGNIENSD